MLRPFWRIVAGFNAVASIILLPWIYTGQSPRATFYAVGIVALFAYLQSVQCLTGRNLLPPIDSD